jgi:hypothetical protein
MDERWGCWLSRFPKVMRNVQEKELFSKISCTSRQCLSTGEKEFFEIPRKANYHRISNAGL